MNRTQQPDGEISVLALVTMGSFMTQVMVSALNVALPALQNEFGMRAASLAWVQTAYLLATAVCMIPAGRLADMIGSRKVYVSGLILYTLATLTCAAAFSSVSLIFFRTVQGIGAAMIFATGMAILTARFFPPVGGAEPSA